MPWAVAAAAITAGGAIYSSSQQADAAKSASGTQMQMYNQMRSDLLPYNQAGQGAINALSSYWGLTPPASALPPSTATGAPVALPSGGTLAARLMGSAAPSTMAMPAGATAPGLSPTSASNAFAALQNYPGYQFQYGQGLQALDRNLASGGRYMSGAMLKDAQTFGQGQAESAVRDYLSMLQYLGTTGANAGAMTGQAGVNTGQGIAQTTLGAGTAQAAGTMGAANAFGGLVQSPSFQNFFGSTPSNTGAAYMSGGNWVPGAQGFPGT